MYKLNRLSICYCINEIFLVNSILNNKKAKYNNKINQCKKRKELFSRRSMPIKKLQNSEYIKVYFIHSNAFVTHVDKWLSGQVLKSKFLLRVFFSHMSSLLTQPTSVCLS